MASTVDQAIEDAVTKRFLPKYTGSLLSAEMIEDHVSRSEWAPYHESGFAETYTQHTAEFCRPIASTLAIHPSSQKWGVALIWTVDQKDARWAIADRVLRISTKVIEKGHLVQQLLKNEDVEKKGTIEQLASHRTALAIWAMKNFIVGRLSAEVMGKIVKMGVTHAKSQWKKCTTPDCSHGWEAMEESRKDYDAGLDARSPPWTPPIVPSTSAATDSRPTPLHGGLGSASESAQGGATSRPSYKEPSSSFVEGGEGVGKKRRRNDSDASEKERPPPKQSKADLMDASYEPPPGARQEVNARSFLQQTWAQAVRNKCTIMVLHSGNHEIIGIRHRETQSLYVSHLIEPHSCSGPAYGKIQVGIHIAAIQETIDRAKQDTSIEARACDPSADTPMRNEEVSSDGDLEDYSPEVPDRLLHLSYLVGD